MEVLFRKPTSTTPFVLFDGKNGICEISGKSLPVDADDFYKPLINWLNKLVSKPPRHLDVHLNLEIFNIASAKRLMHICYKLKDLLDADSRVCVHWYCAEDDEEMLEVGRDYERLAESIPFEFHQSESRKDREERRSRVGHTG